MAVYDRRFLIPYLRDACCIELFCKKLEQEIDTCRSSIQSLNNSIHEKIYVPSRPAASNYLKGSDDSLAAFIPGIIIIIVSFFLKAKLLDLMEIGFVAYIGVAYGAMLIIAGISSVSSMRKDGMKKYNEALAQYERAVQNAKAKEMQIPKLKTSLNARQNQLAALQNNLNSARQMRTKLYDVNIIPRPYRNLHAVYYLYDFFSSGRENDLEKVINTFVLEEIKQRLDHLIQQNEEILLNQRVQMAMQEQQNRISAENNRKQMEQFARMEKNQELQMDYQRMISVNQQVTNFFLAADYYRKYH